MYTANVVYEIRETHYTRVVYILNKGSLRTGAELRLIDDKNEPKNTVAEDGSQSDIIRICMRYIISHIILLVWLIVGVYCFFRFGIEDMEPDD